MHERLPRREFGESERVATRCIGCKFVAMRRCCDVGGVPRRCGAAATTPHSSWCAVLQGLQKAFQYSGKLVSVGVQRADGRFETVRPGSRIELAVRPANLRWFLRSYGGDTAGDVVDFDDGEIELLG